MQKKSTCALIALVAVGISLVSTTSKANAESGTRFEKNGISLNVNKSFGQKDGGIVASQYKTVENDSEQLFDVINLTEDKVLIKSKANGNCLNSYKIYEGTIPNFLKCDSNDSDQIMKIQNNQIIHYNTGLMLNIGSQNNDVVRWIDNSPKYNENGIGQVLKSPVAKKVLSIVIGPGYFVADTIVKNEGYNLVRYCLVDGKYGLQCIDSIKNLSQPVVNDILKNSAGVYDRRETQRNLINSVFGLGYHFQVPNNLPMEWNEAENLCNLKKGKLKWSNGLKTCFQ